MADAIGTIVTFTDRPARLLAEPAGGVRGRRLRRRRPAPGGAHRRRRGRGAHRCPRGADVPQAVHRRRHPQLLLEGEAASDGLARDQGPGRDRRHGLHPLRRALGQGPRRPAARRHRRGVRRAPASTKDDVDAYWLGTAQGGMSRDAAGQAAAARGQAGHPGREHVRHRLRGAAPGRLRGGLGRLRPGHGGRRREGEGLRLPGPQRVPRADRRHAAHAHRRGDVLDGRPRLRRALRRADGRAQGGPRPHRVEEPLQRRPQPPGPVPPRDVGRADPRHARRGRLPLACSTAPAWPTARRRPSCAGPRTPTATPTRRST